MFIGSLSSSVRARMRFSWRVLFLCPVLLMAALVGCASGDGTGTPITSTPLEPGVESTPTLLAPPDLPAAPDLTAPPDPTVTTLPAQPTGTPSAEPSPTPAVEVTEVAVSVPIIETNQPASIPDPAGYQWAEVASGFSSPVGIAHAADGSGRLFVIEQVGRIQVLEPGSPAASLFLDIVDRVGSSGNEQGLLGLAFHPAHEDNGFFYVNYTDRNGDTVIARFTASPPSSQADPGSEQVLLQVDQPFANHNGGGLEFGPDGNLYIGLGDGGSQGDPQGNAQSVDTLLGKLLRIDVDSGDPYAIPPDNPFAGGGGRPEIWAYGLRNPWRFSFDRQTGEMLIGDVGQGQWEEIDYLPAGGGGGTNFGWDLREGAHPYEGGGSTAGLVDPIYEYNHAVGGCSVTGGYVYRGPALPEWQGVYVFGDYCTGLVWGIIPQGGGWQGDVVFQTSFQVTAFGEDESGELYLADRGGGIYRLSPQ
jgi:glucose/arabinose dehydrogenase